MTGERRRFQPGFRARVLGTAAVLLVVAMGAGLLIERTILLARLDRDVSASLEQEAREMRDLSTGNDPDTAEPFAGDVAAIFDTFLSRNVPAPEEAYLAFVDGRLVARSTLARVLDDHPDVTDRWAGLDEVSRGEVETAAGPVRYLAVPLQSGGETQGVFVVVSFVAAEREAIDADLRLSALVVALVVAVTTAIAWFTAGRLLKPLREVTATARTITETDLSRRIPATGDDEVAELAMTFNQMLDRLEAAFATQRAFVDDAGHELRTPITVIMGQLEVMGDDPEDRARTMAIVQDELARMARIVEDLLLLAKTEQPDFVRPEPVELADFTTEVLMKARTLGDRDWSLDACAEGTVELDAQRLTQALLNLARNAVEHTDEGTAVAIGSRRDPERVLFWVRDDGPGVAADDQERIFDRFTRGRGARRRSDGAGLGLAIVQAVATGHGGHVVLDSRPGEGACFTIDLPAEPVPPSTDDPTTRLDPLPPTPPPSPTSPTSPTPPTAAEDDLTWPAS